MIRDGKSLVEALLGVISRDVAEEAGRRRLRRKDYPEFRRRVADAMAQLPEYAEYAAPRRCG